MASAEARAGACWPLAQIVGVGMGQYSSLRLDSGGQPHIACRNHVNSDLLYLTRLASGQWSAETVDPGGDVGRFASLALTADDRPMIAYLDFTNGRLKLAEKKPDGWHIESLQPVTCAGWYCSLALDSTGSPHIAFSACSNPALYLASRLATGQWDVEVVDSVGDVGLYASLKLWQNLPRISYYDRTNTHLKYSEKSADGRWTTVVVDATNNCGLDTSLDMDAAGDPHISYWDNKNGYLKYAFRSGGAWTVETVDAESYGGYESCLNVSSVPRVSYEGAGGLRYAERVDGCWRTWKVDEGGSAAGYTSLAIDSQGNPVISCFRLLSQSLEFRQGMGEANGNVLASSTVLPIGGARRSVTGGWVKTSGVIVSSGGSSAWQAESPDRSAGLGLKMPAGCGLPGLGDEVQFLGVVEDSPSGQRRLQVCSWRIQQSGVQIEPLVVSRPSLLADGMLMKLAGLVDDMGSVCGIPLRLPTAWVQPPRGAFVVVTGVMDRDSAGAYIRPRTPDEVIVVAP